MSANPTTPTEADKHDAFEWLRKLGLQTEDSVINYHCYVILRELTTHYTHNEHATD